MKSVRSLSLTLLLSFVCIASSQSAMANPASSKLARNDVLTRAEMLERSLGGQVREKGTDTFIRVLCLEYSQHATNPACIQFGLVELIDQKNETFVVNWSMAYDSTDPKIEAQESLELKKFAKRSRKKTNAFDIIPGTMVGLVAAGMTSETNPGSGLGLVVGVVLVPVGAAFDVVTAPVRLPLVLIRNAKYNRVIKRFLKSIVNDDRTYSGTLHRDDYSVATDSKNLVEVNQ